MKKLFAFILIAVPAVLICQSLEQCRGELTALMSQFELKKDECKQVQATEYDQKLKELVAVQRDELRALQQKHTTERNSLKETYEQVD